MMIENGIIYSDDGKCVTGIQFGREYDLGDVYIKDGVTTIKNGALSYACLTSLRLPESLRIIEDFAFLGSRWLQNLTVNAGCEYIGHGAFAFEFKDPIRSIDPKNIIIPSTTKTEDDIFDCTFLGCSDGEIIDLGLSSGTKWASENIHSEYNKRNHQPRFYAWGSIHPGIDDTDVKLSDITGSEYDAATFVSQGILQIPTADNFKELINECEWTLLKYPNEYNRGKYIVEWKITGKNGNSITLPLNGYLPLKSKIDPQTIGLYWTSQKGNNGPRALGISSKSKEECRFVICNDIIQAQIRPVCHNDNNLEERKEKFREDLVKRLKSGAKLPITINGITFNLVYVEGGRFIMGKDDEAKEATVNDFLIMESMLTCDVAKELGITTLNTNHPTWNQNGKPAIFTAFPTLDWLMRRVITELKDRTGKEFQIPTEAQWEFAAIGGIKSKGYRYSGSNKIDEVAWYDKNLDHLCPADRDLPYTKLKKPNELGLYDMSGLYWEPCIMAEHSDGKLFADYDLNWDNVCFNSGSISDGKKYCDPHQKTIVVGTPKDKFKFGLRLVLPVEELFQ